MLAKHMKVKKIVLSILTVAMLTSQLVGCATISEENLLAEANSESQVEIEFVEPGNTLGSGENGDIQVGDTTFEITSDKSEVGTRGEIGELDDYLTLYFNQAYSFNKDLETEDLTIIIYMAELDNYELPSNFRELYEDWKENQVEDVENVVDIADSGEERELTPEEKGLFAEGENPLENIEPPAENPIQAPVETQKPVETPVQKPVQKPITNSGSNNNTSSNQSQGENKINIYDRYAEVCKDEPPPMQGAPMLDLDLSEGGYVQKHNYTPGIGIG